MGCFYQLLQVETGNVLTVLMDMQSKARIWHIKLEEHSAVKHWNNTTLTGLHHSQLKCFGCRSDRFNLTTVSVGRWGGNTEFHRVVSPQHQQPLQFVSRHSIYRQGHRNVVSVSINSDHRLVVHKQTKQNKKKQNEINYLDDNKLDKNVSLNRATVPFF